MNKRHKGLRNETPSPYIYNNISRKSHNRSVDLTQVIKPAKGSKIKPTQVLPLLMGIESEFFTRHLMHSLKESLTVKRIEFSPPKALSGVHISTIPLHTRVQKSILPQRVNSFKAIPKLRPKTKSITDSVKHKLIKKCESPRATPKIINSIRKENIIARLPVYTPQPVKVTKQIQRVSYKEASREPKWLVRAKPELQKVWRKIINKSNGVEPVTANNGQTSYKYYVGKGNNSRLINKCFNSRPWWVEVDSTDKANFSWTQWKDKALLEVFDIGTNIAIEKIDAVNMILISPINLKIEKNLFKTVDIEELGFQHVRNSTSYTFVNVSEVNPLDLKMHNKIEFNQHLSNKKGLFKNLKNYYSVTNKNIFDYVPLTFHVVKGENDAEFLKFTEEFNALEQEKMKNKIQNLWIVKPGENTNRGQGISLANSLEQIKSLVTPMQPSEKHTFIIQKYIEKPFLIHKRKFDIRCYSLMTSINGVIQGYFYADGYLRTTSTEYNTKEISNNFIHLTNDAIQKHSEEYGKYEDANKLSYKDFQRYLDFHCSDKRVNFVNDVVPEIKNLIKDTIKAVYLKIDPNRRLHCMEIFGYDFMLDVNLKPWLIEVNTNPCLELASNYLSILIPTMVDNAFRIAVDPLFPPFSKNNSEMALENKFELIFHQEVDGKLLEKNLGINIDALMKSEELSDNEEIYSDKESLL